LRHFCHPHRHPRCLLSHSSLPRDLRSFPTRRSSDLSQLRDEFSQRRLAIIAARTKAVADFQSRHGREPTASEVRRLPAMPRLKIARKSTRLNSSHVSISYAVFCLKKKKQTQSIYKTG